MLIGEQNRDRFPLLASGLCGVREHEQLREDEHQRVDDRHGARTGHMTNLAERTMNYFAVRFNTETVDILRNSLDLHVVNIKEKRLE